MCAGRPHTQVGGGHWEEDCLTTELMTPNLKADRGLISELTVAALEDLGYDVNFGGVEEPDEAVFLNGAGNNGCCNDGNDDLSRRLEISPLGGGGYSESRPSLLPPSGLPRRRRDIDVIPDCISEETYASARRHAQTELSQHHQHILGKSRMVGDTIYVADCQVELTVMNCEGRYTFLEFDMGYCDYDTEISEWKLGQLERRRKE